MSNLILHRKAGESFSVDGPAVITTASIRGNRVKVAIEAPETTRVLRSELADVSQRTAPPQHPVFDQTPAISADAFRDEYDRGSSHA